MTWQEQQEDFDPQDASSNDEQEWWISQDPPSPPSANRTRVYKDLHRPTLSFEQRLAQLHENDDPGDIDDDGPPKMFDSESIFDTSLALPPVEKVSSRKTSHAANIYDDPAEDEVRRAQVPTKKKPAKKGRSPCRKRKKKRKRRSSKRAAKKADTQEKWTDPGRLRPRPPQQPISSKPKSPRNGKQRRANAKSAKPKKDTE